jgi:hypothetical protein
MEESLASPIVSQDAIEALTKYAVRFHEAMGTGHAAASPLGAYLLLAAVAPAARDARRDELERVLGCPVDVAARFLADLLSRPHPVISEGFAVWHDVTVPTPAFDSWRGALPPDIESGPVPDQEAANEWANRLTRGLITEFPVTIPPLTIILLASALATRAKWTSPLWDVPATELGQTSWAAEVNHVLSHSGQIVWTESAGLVGASIARGEDGLVVVSVIGDPTAAPASIIAAAHEVAAWDCKRPASAAPRSLFELPLGSGHAWEVVESRIMTHAEGDRIEVVRALHPAWEASSPTMDLMANPAFGFEAAGATLLALLNPSERGLAFAAQRTVARFDRYGFSAASVSVLGVTGSSMGRRPQFAGLRRDATIRFARPFAVVAVTQSPDGRPHPWHGVPVFSAWVTKPSEPEPEKYPEWVMEQLEAGQRVSSRSDDRVA